MKKTVAAVCIVVAALASTATAAAPTVTMAASATSAAYGTPVALGGQVSTKKANQQVSVDATVCPSTKAAKAATARTNATGVYQTSVIPAAATKYQASFKNATSALVAVSVKPLVALKRPARGSYVASVTAGQSLSGKFVLFQRYRKLRKRWAQVKRVALATSTPGTAPTVVSSVSFKAKLPRGTRVRVMISTAQAAPCYVTAASKSLRA
jgi:hypothetical protein